MTDDYRPTGPGYYWLQHESDDLEVVELLEVDGELCIQWFAYPDSECYEFIEDRCVGPVQPFEAPEQADKAELAWTQETPTRPGLYWGFHPEDQKRVVVCRVWKNRDKMLMEVTERYGCTKHLSKFPDWFWMGPIRRPESPPDSGEPEPLQCEVPYDREKNAVEPKEEDMMSTPIKLKVRPVEEQIMILRADLLFLTDRVKETEEELEKHRARLTTLEGQQPSTVDWLPGKPTEPGCYWYEVETEPESRVDWMNVSASGLCPKSMAMLPNRWAGPIVLPDGSSPGGEVGSANVILKADERLKLNGRIRELEEALDERLRINKNLVKDTVDLQVEVRDCRKEQKAAVTWHAIIEEPGFYWIEARPGDGYIGVTREFAPIGAGANLANRYGGPIPTPPGYTASGERIKQDDDSIAEGEQEDEQTPSERYEERTARTRLGL